MILDKTSASLYTTLQAGTALTARLAGTTSIYSDQAPDNATFPYIVFNHQGGGPDNIAPVNLENNLWYMRVYSTTSQKDATEIFDLADQRINRVALTISGYKTFWCNRETNIRLVENLPSGERIFSCGGVYRVRTSE